MENSTQEHLETQHITNVVFYQCKYRINTFILKLYTLLRQ